jgi:DNA-binding NarL/FixJ family response regulator
MPQQIVILDDHPVIAQGLSLLLEGQPDFEVVQSVQTLPDLWKALEHSPDILILDLNLNGQSSLEFLAEIRAILPRLKVLAFSSYNTPNLVKQAFRAGCHGYLLKDTTREGLLEALYSLSAEAPYYGKGVARGPARIKGAPDAFPRLHSLSRREREVVALLRQGLDSQSIAAALHISKHTVQSHRKSIFRKLGVRSAAELIKYLHEH